MIETNPPTEDENGADWSVNEIILSEDPILPDEGSAPAPATE